MFPRTRVWTRIEQTTAAVWHTSQWRRRDTEHRGRCLSSGRRRMTRQHGKVLHVHIMKAVHCSTYTRTPTFSYLLITCRFFPNHLEEIDVSHCTVQAHLKSCFFFFLEFYKKDLPSFFTIKVTIDLTMQMSGDCQQSSLGFYDVSLAPRDYADQCI